MKVRAERFGAALDHLLPPQILPERLAPGNDAAMDVDGAFTYSLTLYLPLEQP